MLPETTHILDTFFRTFAPSSRPLLMLDYDGTLAPFRVDRFEAVPSPGVREILNQILAQQKTKIAIVSGRPACEIVPLLALDAPVEVWGLHGFERLHAGGRRELQPLQEEARRQLDQLHAALHKDSFGGLFEAKPNAAVMHWRGLPIEQAAQIEQQTRALFEPLAQQGPFRLLPFQAGLELRIGRDKGDAVQLLLEECRDCAPAAYLGDDLTDEAAFQSIKGRGLSVLVRAEPRETAADVRLTPPDELLDFLERWRQAGSPTSGPELSVEF